MVIPSFFCHKGRWPLTSLRFLPSLMGEQIDILDSLFSDTGGDLVWPYFSISQSFNNRSTILDFYTDNHSGSI
jgi:hypothetical protein